MYKLISNISYEGHPGFPNKFTLTAEQVSALATGGYCNSYRLTMSNHTGTHYDAPKHFCDTGLKISELEMDRFVFDKPFLLKLDKPLGSEITKEDFEPYADQLAKCDLLLLYTGLAKYRVLDPQKFSEDSCCVTADAAKYLIDNFHNIKVVGMDFISLSKPTKHEDGKEAHRYLLGSYNNMEHFICIIEDMNLTALHEGDVVEKVFALPLFIKELDSAPVTVLAQIKD